MKMIYQCPVCRQELQKVEKSYVCLQKHSFDISKEGYVNLLLANQKKTKNPGDNKFMVDNRKYFLDQGYYDRMSETTGETILGRLAAYKKRKDRHFNILDAGCGEGFYTSMIQKFLVQKKFDEEVEFWGIDISKFAIQKAAKRDDAFQFCIGSTFDFPYMAESFHIIFSVFAPFDAKELLRILKPGGSIICVRPGPGHLKELAALIYEKAEQQGKALDLADSFGIPLLEKKELQYQIHLKKSEDIMSLVAMTPYYWHLNKEKEALLADKKELSVSMDFQFYVFQKPTE